MKIKKIFIRNFRPIGSDGLELNFQVNHTTIIGENNVGKSSILEAIKRITQREVAWDIEDWHDGDQDKTIEIRVECILDEVQMLEIINLLALPITVLDFKDSFSDVLICEAKKIINQQTSLLFKLGKLSIENDKGWVRDIDPTKGYASIYVGNVIDKIQTLKDKQKVIDIIRDYLDMQMITSQLSNAKIDFANDTSRRLLELLNKDMVVIEEFREKPQKALSDFLISPTGRELASVLFNLKNARPELRKHFDKIKEQFHQLFPMLQLDVIRENNEIKILIQKEKIESTTLYLGAGILQSLLMLTHTIAHNQKVLCVDYPESHLHPHAQRRLALFMEKSEGGQILMVTHSPYFVSLRRSNCILRAMQTAAQTKLIELPQNYFTDDEYFKLEQFLDIDTKELFFAKKIVLVEGPTEVGALPIFAGKIGYNFDENGVSVIDVGGKTAFEIFVKICEGFQIPYVIVADDDARENLERIKKTYPNCKSYVLNNKFDDLLPKELREEAVKIVGRSKPRIGKYVARKMVDGSYDIPEEIRNIITNVKIL